MHQPQPPQNQTSIGVFDSGIGGLSNLRALMKAMPQQHFTYIADMAYAPYGEHSDGYILERSQKVAHWLRSIQHTRGLVIACNTATAAAAKLLREQFGPGWPIIGVEPALKPAAALSQSGRIGIMATASTLGSSKFQTLMRRVHENERIALQLFLCPCEGLAKAIDDDDVQQIQGLVQRYCQELSKSRPDVVVLGCTHYPLVSDFFVQAMPGVHVLDASEAVARRAKSVFMSDAAPGLHHFERHSRLAAYTTADPQHLQKAIERWLPEIGMPPEVRHVDI